MTRPMRKLPRTQAPIAIRQLSPTAIIDEATPRNINNARSSGSYKCRSKLTNFPVRHSPRICHPIRYIGAPIPGSLRRWDRVEIRIGRVLRRCKRALFLVNFEAEVESESSPHRADSPRFRVGSDPKPILNVRAVWLHVRLRWGKRGTRAINRVTLEVELLEMIAKRFNRK